MIDCGSYYRCSVCDKIQSCVEGQKIVLNRQCPDRSPDALTNDYIYMRGEYDAFVPMTKRDVQTASRAYEIKIELTRKELGL